MKKISYLFPVILLLLLAENATARQVNDNSSNQSNFENTIEMQPDSVLRHTVFFSFKESSSAEDVQSIVDAFRNLQNEINGIQSFEWGTNSSPEGLNQGLTHAFTLTFHSDGDRDAYLPHPAHKRFGELLGPHLDKVMVVDYWARD